MRNPAILHPMFALAAWTLLVLLLIPLVRARAARRREIVIDDFRDGESANVPAAVRIPNRNYMNLLELPMLFYIVCLVLYVTGGASSIAIAIGWAFVAFRVVHSIIHLTYNRVLHRLAAFTAANVSLVLLWAIAAAHLFAAPP
jgi:hypothetical protein